MADKSSETHLIRSLEPRLMFDAAAGETHAETAAQQIAQQQAEPSQPAPAAQAPSDTTVHATADQADTQNSADSSLTNTSAVPNSLSATLNSASDLSVIASALAEHSITQQTGAEYVFVDTSVPDYQALLTGINPAAQVVLINSQQDGVSQIQAALAGQQDVAAIYLISHGGAGEIELGSALLNSQTISSQYAADWQIIGQSLAKNADIIIYGCDFAAGPSGLQAVNELATLTGATVAASNDNTGAAALGGNWTLEVQTGPIDAAPVLNPQALADYPYLLDLSDPQLQINTGVVSVSNSQASISGVSGNWLGTDNTSSTPFTGIISSSTEVSGSLSNFQAGDIFRLATSVENTGGGGAFGVSVSIGALPNALGFVGGSLATADLKVAVGDGAVLVQGVDYSVSGNTITLLDNNGMATLAAGVAGAAPVTNGSNVLLITYDTIALNTLAATTTMSTTASLTQYSSAPDSANILTSPLTASATEVSASPTATMQLFSTSNNETNINNMVIGESALYVIKVTLPEGVTNDISFTPNIPAGMVLDTSYGYAGYKVFTTQAAANAEAAGMGNLLPADYNPTPDNNPNNNSYLVVIKLIVADSNSNRAGDVKPINLTLGWESGNGDFLSVNTNTLTETIVEPSLTITDVVTDPAASSATSLLANAGDPLQYTITISNPSGVNSVNAFDLLFADSFTGQFHALTILSAELGATGFTPGSGVNVLNQFEISGTTIQTLGGLSGGNPAVNLTLAPGQSIVLTVDAVSNNISTPLATLSSNAQVQWSSADAGLLPPDQAANVRTGVDGVGDGVNNYAAAAAAPITIQYFDHAPLGADNVVSLNYGSSYTFNVNDFGFQDPNNFPADAFAGVVISALPPAAQGQLSLNGAAVLAGQFVPAAQIGGLSFTPAAGVSGPQIGAFSFQVVNDGTTINGGQNTDPVPKTFAFDVPYPPELQINTGVVSVSNSQASISGVSGNWLGTDNTSSTPFTGIISSSTEVSGSLSNFQAGDIFRLATSVENTGGGGAFGVSVSIGALPNALGFVGGSLATADLKVAVGDGAVLVQGVDYSVSGNTITLLDNNGMATLAAGVAGAAPVTNGSNVLLITYDTVALNTLAATTTMSTTASLTQYSSAPDSANILTSPLTASATEVSASPTATMQLFSTSNNETNINNMVIGESALYVIKVTLPEGVTNNISYTPNIPAGMVLDTSYGVAGSKVITTQAAANAEAAGMGNLLSADYNPTPDNNPNNNSYLVVIKLIVADSNSNRAGDVKPINLTLGWESGNGDFLSVNTNTLTETIVEPSLTITDVVTDPAASSATSLLANAGDPLQYTITISNPSGVNSVNAFDLLFADSFTGQFHALTILSAELGATGFTPGSGVNVLNQFEISGTTIQTLGGLSGGNPAVNLTLAPGQSIVLTVDAVSNNISTPLATLSSNAQVQWSSADAGLLPPDQAANVRTGVDGVGDGVNNYAAAAAAPITIQYFDHAPLGADNVVSLNYGSSYTFNVNDFGFQDPNNFPADAFAGVVISALPPAAQGQLSLNGAAVLAGQFVPAAQIGGLSFTPAAGVSGPQIGAFSFQVVNDGTTINGGQNTDPVPKTFAFDVPYPPELQINTGVVSVSNSQASISGISGNWLGTDNTSSTPFTGIISSSTEVSGSLSNFQAGDIFRLATSVENTGGGGAFGVSVSIGALPNALGFVGGSLATADLKVAVGDGAVLVQGVDYSVSGNTITLLDNNGMATLAAGVAGAAPVTNGSNVLLITYDTVALNTLAATTTMSTTASLTQYSSAPDSANILTSPLTASATEVSASPTATMQLFSTSNNETNINNMVIGESALYVIKVTLPEGVTNNISYTPNIPAGMILDTSYGVAGSKVITTQAAANAEAAGMGNLLSADYNPTPDNNPNNNSYLVVIKLIVADSNSNRAGDVKPINLTLGWESGNGDFLSVNTNTLTETIVEPSLTITDVVTDPAASSATSLLANAGDPLQYTITISNPSGVNSVNAFDLLFADSFTGQFHALTILSAELGATGFTPGSGVNVLNQFEISGTTIQTLGGLSGGNPAVNLTLAPGQSIVLTVDAVSNNISTPLATLSSNAQVQWSSADAGLLPPDQAANVRTGVDGVGDGVNNYAAAAAAPITIQYFDHAPLGADNVVSLNYGSSYTFNVNDFGFQDPNNFPADAFAGVVISALPPAAQGQLSLNGAAVLAGQFVPAAQIAGLSFTPAASVSGPQIGAFSFQVRNDGTTINGGQNTDPAPKTFAFDVPFINNAPPLSNNAATFVNNAPPILDKPLLNKVDMLNQNFTGITITGLPLIVEGVLNLNGSPVSVDQFIPLAQIGGLSFSAIPGTKSASLSYQVADNAKGSGEIHNIQSLAFNLISDVVAGNDHPDSHQFSPSDFGFTDPNDNPADVLGALVAGTVPLGGFAATAGLGSGAGSAAGSLGMAAGGGSGGLTPIAALIAFGGRAFRNLRPFTLPLALIAALLFVFFFKNIIITIESGEAGVLYHRFSGTDTDTIYPEGLHIISPWNIMYIYQVRKQVALHEFDVISNKGLTIHLALAVRYLPEYELLGILHQRIGPDYLQRVILPQIESVMRKSLGNYSAEQIYTNEEGLLTKTILTALDEVGRNYVHVEDIIIRSIVLPPEIINAIEDKLKQEEFLKSYEFRIQTAGQEGQRLKIEADAIRNYNKLVNDTLTTTNLMHKGIMATQKLADSPNPKVVIIGSGKNGMPLILGSDQTPPASAPAPASMPAEPPAGKPEPSGKPEKADQGHE